MRERAGLVFPEVNYIQNRLSKFLPWANARELAKQVYDLVIDVDKDIDRILRDPLAEKLYEYDGQFFTPRDSSGFHTAFDGRHILRSLGNSVDTVFKALPRQSAIKALLDDIDTYRWLARRRRMNWEEFRTLGLIPEEIIRQIVAAHKRESGPAPLSDEEQTFFKSFEEQLEQSRKDSFIVSDQT